MPTRGYLLVNQLGQSTHGRNLQSLQKPLLRPLYLYQTMSANHRLYLYTIKYAFIDILKRVLLLDTYLKVHITSGIIASNVTELESSSLRNNY